MGITLQGVLLGAGRGGEKKNVACGYAEVRSYSEAGC
jgi:hypothetical protein